MAIGEHITQFVGQPVEEWDPSRGLAAPAGKMIRIACEYDDEEAWPDKLAAMLEDPASREVTGVVVGPWGSDPGGDDAPDDVIEALVAAREALPNLRATFLGDITFEENEISWIHQSDLSPLLGAYPRLEHLAVRGSDGLTFGALRHASLRTLIVQSGGLPVEIVHQIGAADLPNLEHLELWLGDEGYGADTTVDDLAPVLRGEWFPRLRYLGLKNSTIQDDIAAAVALAPVLDRLEILDLSMGTLSDDGAAALLDSPAVRKLKRLDIHHHYCAGKTVARLRELGIDVDVGDPQGEAEADDRYVEVSE